MVGAAGGKLALDLAILWHDTQFILVREMSVVMFGHHTDSWARAFIAGIP